MIVIPGVCGLGVYQKNSEDKGISVDMKNFCNGLVGSFKNFHHLEKSKACTEETVDHAVVKLLFSAKLGNLEGVRRYWLKPDFDMNTSDYDGRTAMHVAASEGHLEIIKFLKNCCKCKVDLKDRFGHTAVDDAKQFGHPEIEKLLISK